MKINILEPRVYNRISAGEVVERPSSIVKELVENSIDAGAKNIRIEIEEGGIKNITVSDDGCGIEKDDLTSAFLPHATSKIKDVDDLDSIESLGFRGEALASISSVCQVKLSSKTRDSEVGYSIKVNGGIFDKVSEVARENGTTISCSNLFYNTPVRAKFLRKPKTEESEVTHLVERFMLSHSDIAFNYYIDGKLVYNTTSCSMQDIIYTIYGNEVYENLIEVNYSSEGIKVTGFVTKPKISKSNRTYQTLFVNGRTVENFLISNAVQSVYESFLMKGRFPIYVLSIDVSPKCVDVNVHPSKKEVKFDNPNKIFGIVRKAVENALLSSNQIASFIAEDYVNNFTNSSLKSLVDREDLVKDFGQRGVVLENLSQADYEKDDNSIHKENNSHVPNDLTKQRQMQEMIDNISLKSLLERKPIGESEGRSYKKDYSIDLIDTSVKPANPEQFDIEVKKVEEEDVIDQNGNKVNKDLDDLSKLSIKDYIIESKTNSTFFFDQDGSRYSPDIRSKFSEEKFLNASVKDEMKILGTLFKTYIVIEYDDSVYFIDQHAGHERLLYDRLVKAVDSNNNLSQDLLAPYEFTLGAKESQQIDLALDELKKLGFDIEKNGYTYKIKSVPYVLTSIELNSFVDELVKDSIHWDKKPSDYIHSKLCQTACKHAIKAGDSISNDDCAYIIEEVRKGVMLCPHGRPITLVITKHEFEKMFKRIV